MRKPRHRPIAWPVFLARRNDCHPDRETCHHVVSDPTRDAIASTTDVEVAHVCPTCGSTQGCVELGPSEDEPG